MDIEFCRIDQNGTSRPIMRTVAEEVPIAIEFNGLGYAVLMASPEDLVDLAVGFAYSERLIDDIADVVDAYHHATPEGILLRLTLASRVAKRVYDRVRHRVSESACGLCGLENLSQAIRPLPTVSAKSNADHAAIFRALASLRKQQPLNRATGGVHAAAACAADGSIWLAREDVGRHNAFDKLIGAMLRNCRDWESGFALLSSRCSFELVEKAVLARCPLLVSISAPTSLALTRAAAAGLPMRVLARADAILATDTTLLGAVA